MNPERLLEDITELMELADAEAAKGGRLHKAGASAHAKTKAEHHEKMAELHAKIADHHASMSDHYKDGAKGAYKDDARKTDGGDDDDEEDTEKDDAKKSIGYGALESIRNRPSRRAEPLTRATVAEMFGEFGQNFMKSLVAVLRPPEERAPDSDAIAAAALLRSKGFAVEDPSLSQRSVSKAVALDTDAAGDKGKTGATERVVDAVKEEADIAVLKAKATDGDIEARIRLEALAKEEVRKSLRNPQVATSGQMAGFRGRPAAG